MSLPPRRNIRRSRKKHRQLNPRRLLLLVAILSAILVGTVGGLAFGNLVTGLPSVEGLDNYSGQNSVLYDIHGQAVGYLPGAQDRTVVGLAQIPKYLQEGVIATEDSRFYQNNGFDIRGIARSVWTDLRGRTLAQGGSTISEQLAKDLFLSDQKTFSRKIKQIILGVELERRYTKTEILDAYLNLIYLGQGAYGVDSAARVYFDEPLSHLDLAQCALLAGLPQLPTTNDPYQNPKGALERRHEVLYRMVAQGYITVAQATVADHEPLNLHDGTLDTSSPEEIAPFFVDEVYRYLATKLGSKVLAQGNLQIYTTLDPKIQVGVDKAVSDVFDKSFPVTDPLHPRPQAAAVVMDPKTGYVLALYGGRSHPVAFPENWATARRQPGSTIKPVAEYAAALETGYTQMTVLNDAPWMTLKGKPWPQNDDHIYRGRISLRKALALSDNNIAVRLLRLVGLSKTYDTATKQFGLPLSPNDKNLAMGIGALRHGVSVLNLTDAYATFPNQGVRPEPIFVTKVLDAQGNVLLRNVPKLHPVLSPQTAFIETQMLEGVIQRGTGYQVADIGRPAAGKTGTSEDFKDGWFIGYTPNLVAGVWEGNEDNSTQGHDIFGATYAAPIWQKIMKTAVAGTPVRDFPQPKGLVWAKVSNESGLLPSPLTPPDHIKGAWFVDGTQPDKVGNEYVALKVDASNPSYLYDPSDPNSQPLTKVFLRYPGTNTDGPLGMLTGGDLPLPTDAGDWPPTTTNPNPTPAPSAGSTQSASLTIQGGQISPATLSVPMGTALTLTIQNQDTTPYTFQLPGLSVSSTVPATGSATVTVTASSSGTFSYGLTESGPSQGQLTVSTPNGGP